jgi:hypothetical protein
MPSRSSRSTPPSTSAKRLLPGEDLTLVAFALIAALPYALRGPGYVLDDWFALANARFDGWWMAAGAEQWRARPGAGAVYAVVFGAVGRHPAVALAVQVALVGTAAVLLRRLLVRFVEPSLAMAAAALWLVVPNHGSLLLWTSAANITAALVLLLGGLVLVAGGRPALAAFLLALSVLCYEATAPAAAAGTLVVPMLQGRSPRRAVAWTAATLVPAGAWMLAFFHPAKRGVRETADLLLVPGAHVGEGVFPAGPAALTLGTVAFVVLTFVAVDAVRGRRWGPEAGLVGAGVAVIVLGTLPFVRYFYAPLGAGDRVNVVAGVGTALLWVGLGAWLWRRWPRPAVVAAGAVAVVVMGIASVQRSWSWADAVDDGERTLAAVRPLLAPGATVEVPAPPMRRNIAAFLDHSNIAGAVQVEAGTRDVDARLVP